MTLAETFMFIAFGLSVASLIGVLGMALWVRDKLAAIQRSLFSIDAALKQTGAALGATDTAIAQLKRSVAAATAEPEAKTATGQPLKPAIIPLQKPTHGTG